MQCSAIAAAAAAAPASSRLVAVAVARLCACKVDTDTGISTCVSRNCEPYHPYSTKSSLTARCLQIELREKHAPLRLELSHAPRRVLHRGFGLSLHALLPMLRMLMRERARKHAREPSIAKRHCAGF